nr:MAG: wsv295-like protein [Chiromantes dehaani nimavirus]
MSGSTISLGSRPPKEEEIAVASPAWVPVEENEETLESAPLERFSDMDEEEEEEEEEESKSVSELRRRSLINNNHSDDGNDLFSDNEENVCHRRSECCDHDDAEKEPTTNCCNMKEIAIILARGVCNFLNTFVTCVKEKLTRRQMFILVSAAFAVLFKTKNVADPSADDDDGGDGGGDVDANFSSSASADIMNTIIDATVDTIVSTDEN